jgi:hypothetical protein
MNFRRAEVQALFDSAAEKEEAIKAAQEALAKERAVFRYVLTSSLNK